MSFRGVGGRPFLGFKLKNMAHSSFWWGTFISHISWTYPLRIAYLQSIPVLFCVTLRLLVASSSLLDDTALVEKISHGIFRLILAVLCAVISLIPRHLMLTARTGVPYSTTEHVLFFFLSVLATIWTICFTVTVATRMVPSFSDPGCILIFISSFLMQLRYLNKRIFCFKFNQDTSFPPLYLSRIFSQGASQLFLCILAAGLVRYVALLMKFLFYLLLPFTWKNNLAKSLDMAVNFLFLPGYFHSDTLSLGLESMWIHYPLVILLVLWTITMMELHNVLIQSSLRDLSEMNLVSVKEFPLLSDLCFEDECIVAWIMYLSVKDIPLCFDSIASKWKLPQQPQQYHWLKEAIRKQGLAPLERFWWWETSLSPEKKFNANYDLTSILLKNDLRTDSLFHGMLQDKYIWMEYTAAMSRRLRDLHRLLLAYIKQDISIIYYDEAQLSKLTGARLDDGSFGGVSSLREGDFRVAGGDSMPRDMAADRRSIPNRSFGEYSSFAAFANSEEFFISIVLGTLYLKGVTQWMCLANALDIYDNVIRRTLYDTAWSALVLVRLVRELNPWAEGVGFRPYILENLTMLTNVANDTLQRFQAYRQEILTYTQIARDPLIKTLISGIYSV